VCSSRSSTGVKSGRGHTKSGRGRTEHLKCDAIASTTAQPFQRSLVACRPTTTPNKGLECSLIAPCDHATPTWANVSPFSQRCAWTADAVRADRMPRDQQAVVAPKERVQRLPLLQQHSAFRFRGSSTANMHSAASRNKFSYRSLGQHIVDGEESWPRSFTSA
jgi:hypothetical protein